MSSPAPQFKSISSSTFISPLSGPPSWTQPKCLSFIHPSFAYLLSQDRAILKEQMEEDHSSMEGHLQHQACRAGWRTRGARWDSLSTRLGTHRQHLSCSDECQALGWAPPTTSPACPAQPGGAGAVSAARSSDSAGLLTRPGGSPQLVGVPRFPWFSAQSNWNHIMSKRCMISGSGRGRCNQAHILVKSCC